MTGIQRLNHAVLFVGDIGAAVTFYVDILGFTVAATEPAMNAAFLRTPHSTNHHDLGLFGLGPDTARPHRGSAGLYHLAWQVDTIDDLAQLRRSLVTATAYTGESSHGATKSVYGADPSGNEFEIMWLLPRDAWGVYEDKAIVEHLDLDAEVARWSGVSTGHESNPVRPD